MRPCVANFRTFCRRRPCIEFSRSLRAHPQIWSCTCKALIMANFWPTNRHRCPCPSSTINCAKSWSSNSSICATMPSNRCPPSWTSSRTVTWLTTSFCWSLARCINVPFPSWSQSVIRWAVSSRWKPFMWPPIQLNCTMLFWSTLRWRRSLSIAFPNRIWTRWTLKSFVTLCTKRTWRRSMNSARDSAAPPLTLCAKFWP